MKGSREGERKEGRGEGAEGARRVWNGWIAARGEKGRTCDKAVAMEGVIARVRLWGLVVCLLSFSVSYVYSMQACCYRFLGPQVMVPEQGFGAHLCCSYVVAQSHQCPWVRIFRGILWQK